MKKVFTGIGLMLLAIFSLSGCGVVGGKNASLSVVYGAAAVVSLLLLMICYRLVHKNRKWFMVLFSSVLLVNVGYTFLSVSTGLEMALWANRVAYLGSVFLPYTMLMIILETTHTAYPKWLRYALGALAGVVFLIAASPGILPIYYKEVSFAVINGVSVLVKVYGPLHPVYLLYLVGYFSAMVAVIARAYSHKSFDNTAQAVIVAIAVFVNMGVWFIEQTAHFDFEFLSLSYIISELFLLGANMMINEHQRIKEQLLQLSTKNTPVAEEIVSEADITEIKDQFIKGYSELTPKEKEVFDMYVAGYGTKEILAGLNIKENTLKYHNKNIYTKLGITSRKQLVAVYKQLCITQQLSDE